RVEAHLALPLFVATVDGEQHRRRSVCDGAQGTGESLAVDGAREVRVGRVVEGRPRLGARRQLWWPAPVLQAIAGDRRRPRLVERLREALGFGAEGPVARTHVNAPSQEIVGT